MFYDKIGAICNECFVSEGRINDEYLLSMNTECTNSTNISPGNDFIVFGQVVDNKRHLNGSSIVYEQGIFSRADSGHQRVIALITWLQTKVTKDNWSCS